MKQSFAYILKVWLTSVFLAPLLWTAFEYIRGDSPPIFDLLFIVLALGFILSIPRAAISLYCCYLLSQSKLSSINLKLLLALIGATLVFIPFWLFNETDTKIDPFLLSPLIIYTIVVVGGIWFYSVETNIQAMES